VPHQRVDATKRAFNRADALVSITQAYLRGDRPDRAPVEVMITIPASNLRNGTADSVDVGCMGDSCLSTEGARRLSCDAGVIEVAEDEHGVPLSVSAQAPHDCRLDQARAAQARHGVHLSWLHAPDLPGRTSYPALGRRGRDYSIELGPIGDRSSALLAVGSWPWSPHGLHPPISSGRGSAQ
jgi:hypothetical protein